MICTIFTWPSIHKQGIEIIVKLARNSALSNLHETFNKRWKSKKSSTLKSKQKLRTISRKQRLKIRNYILNAYRRWYRLILTFILFFIGWFLRRFWIFWVRTILTEFFIVRHNTCIFSFCSRFAVLICIEGILRYLIINIINLSRSSRNYPLASLSYTN